MLRSLITSLTFLSIGLAAVTANAQPKEFDITIKNHRFEPTKLNVPANQKIILRVHNQDATPEEFESDDFKREKIINGNSSATLNVGPLAPGTYKFFGEFHLDTAQGTLVAE